MRLLVAPPRRKSWRSVWQPSLLYRTHCRSVRCGGVFPSELLLRPCVSPKRIPIPFLIPFGSRLPIARSVNEPSLAFIAWTTTPWTLPSNLALCVNPELDYVRLRHGHSAVTNGDPGQTERDWICVASRVDWLCAQLKLHLGQDITVVGEPMKGSQFVGETPTTAEMKSINHPHGNKQVHRGRRQIDGGLLL